jgi:5-formyltetrahydrofolate cyclo-ligase
MAVPSHPSKPELRSAALDQRRDYARTLAPKLRDILESRLRDIVLPHLIEARVVAGYYPLRDEISPLAILESLGPGQSGVLPWFADRDARMLFRKVPAEVPSPWGVLQPPGSADALAPDVVLVPLVFADRNGTRIGHGKGHYDRALSHLRELGIVSTIGIAWDNQISDDPLPADPWDISLDAIATPSEWIDCRR